MATVIPENRMAVVGEIVAIEKTPWGRNIVTLKEPRTFDNALIDVPVRVTISDAAQNPPVRGHYMAAVGTPFGRIIDNEKRLVILCCGSYGNYEVIPPLADDAARVIPINS